MIVNENQKGLYDDVKTTFEGASSHLLRRWSDETIDIGQGRIEQRTLEASDELKGYIDWHGLCEVFRLTLTTIIKKTGELSKEVEYGITSLSSIKASPIIRDSEESLAYRE